MTVTNKDIINYVKSNFGYKPESCWIAHVKEICGIHVKIAHNRISKDKRKVSCPENKINDIKKALLYFRLIE